jgi:hypothetical protein
VKRKSTLAPNVQTVHPPPEEQHASISRQLIAGEAVHPLAKPDDPPVLGVPGRELRSDAELGQTGDVERAPPGHLGLEPLD